MNSAADQTTADGAPEKANHTLTRSRVKSLIINIALWGLIPTDLAMWLIQRGGLRHE
jgi:hypothetical protein